MVQEARNRARMGRVFFIAPPYQPPNSAENFALMGFLLG
jgi:hypothetical protein